MRLNPRQEKFARLVLHARAKGLPAYLAYRAAGYKASLEYSPNGKASPAMVRASALLRTGKVQARLCAIMTEASRRHPEVTEDSLLLELEEARQAAIAADQAGAAVQATMGKARITGKIVDRKEVGKPGDFDAMSDAELAAWIKDNAPGQSKTSNVQGADSNAPRIGEGGNVGSALPLAGRKPNETLN